MIIHNIKIKIILLSLFVINSCEKVIDIDLSSVEPQIVIDGIITDQLGPYTVKISKTGDYFNPEAFPAVTDASVTITDDAGNSETLTEVADGIYLISTIQGVPGRNYTLKVIAENEEFTGISTMQEAIEIDSLTYEYVSGSFIGPDEGYRLYCHYTPPNTDETYCRFIIYRNGDLFEEYYLSGGALNKGIDLDKEDDFGINDTVKLELLSLDKTTYIYYSNLSSILGISGSSRMMSGTSANPNTNLSNGALGYFGAFTVRSDSIVIH